MKWGSVRDVDFRDSHHQWELLLWTPARPVPDTPKIVMHRSPALEEQSAVFAESSPSVAQGFD
jgi:hypothetical protein